MSCLSLSSAVIATTRASIAAFFGSVSHCMRACLFHAPGFSSPVSKWGRLRPLYHLSAHLSRQSKSQHYVSKLRNSRAERGGGEGGTTVTHLSPSITITISITNDPHPPQSTQTIAAWPQSRHPPTTPAAASPAPPAHPSRVSPPHPPPLGTGRGRCWPSRCWWRRRACRPHRRNSARAGPWRARAVCGPCVCVKGGGGYTVSLCVCTPSRSTAARDSENTPQQSHAPPPPPPSTTPPSRPSAARRPLQAGG